MTDDPCVTLSARDVSVRFGGLTAVDRLSLDVADGLVTGLVGPNGAGKTTLFNAITGHQRVTSGTVTLLGSDVTNEPPASRARRGMARTFQLGVCVEELTVLENVVLGVDHRCRAGGRMRARDRRDAAREVLSASGLALAAARLAGDLPAGLRREVEIARAIACGGRLLLLDEPGVGLTEGERERLCERVRQLAGEGGMAVLVTDHNTDFVFAVADVVVAMNFGAKIAEGPPRDVREAPAVIEAYLGLTRAAA